MVAPSAEAMKIGMALKGPRGIAASRRAISARERGPGISVRIWIVFMMRLRFERKRIPHSARNDKQLQEKPKPAPLKTEGCGIPEKKKADSSRMPAASGQTGSRNDRLLGVGA